MFKTWMYYHKVWYASWSWKLFTQNLLHSSKQFSPFTSLFKTRSSAFCPYQGVKGQAWMTFAMSITPPTLCPSLLSFLSTLNSWLASSCWLSVGFVNHCTYANVFSSFGAFALRKIKRSWAMWSPKLSQYIAAKYIRKITYQPVQHHDLALNLVLDQQEQSGNKAHGLFCV